MAGISVEHSVYQFILGGGSPLTIKELNEHIPVVREQLYIHERGIYGTLTDQYVRVDVLNVEKNLVYLKVIREGCVPHIHVEEYKPQQRSIIGVTMARVEVNEVKAPKRHFERYDALFKRQTSRYYIWK